MNRAKLTEMDPLIKSDGVKGLDTNLVDNSRITFRFNANSPVTVSRHCFQARKSNDCRERVLMQSISRKKSVRASVNILTPGTVIVSSKRTCMFFIVTCALLIIFSIVFSTRPIFCLSEKSAGNYMHTLT